MISGRSNSYQTINMMKYIPQAPPFEMIDELIEANLQESSTSLTIREDNIFVKDGVFTEPGLIENMAQTAAAGIGYMSLNAGEKESPIGFIGQIKNLKINYLPSVGQKLKTTTSIQNSLMNIRVLSCIIKGGAEMVASAEINVFIQEHLSINPS